MPRFDLIINGISPTLKTHSDPSSEMTSMMTRNRTSTAQGRIIIVGTGRAGTTFLVQLFTALAFDTGFSLKNCRTQIDEIAQAGLERGNLVRKKNPYVIKSPWYADQLEEALRLGQIKIYAALVPVRDLFDAAESRRRVYWEASRRGLPPLRHGSLWYTETPSDQEQILALQFYKTVFPLVRYEVPTYFLEFPRLVRDPEYLFRQLELLMRDHGVSNSEFLHAHGMMARPELVHDFGDQNHRSTV